MQTDKSIRERYDEVSPEYDEAKPLPASHRAFWWVYERLTLRPVQALLPTDGRQWRILDAGGGSGKYGVQLAALGHHVTVLDLSPGMLELARARFTEQGLLERADFRVGNILELPFADKSFDLVFCEGDPVSYCLDEHPRAMRELMRVVTPGGPVVMGVDNRLDYFWGALRFGDKKKALSVLLTGKARCPYGLPIHAFAQRELRQAVEAAGGEVVEIFGKPVLFFDILEALAAERGEGFDPWEAREELLALQERLVHEGYADTGVHFQVMARRRQE